MSTARGCGDAEKSVLLPVLPRTECHVVVLCRLSVILRESGTVRGLRKDGKPAMRVEHILVHPLRARLAELHRLITCDRKTSPWLHSPNGLHEGCRREVPAQRLHSLSMCKSTQAFVVQLGGTCRELRSSRPVP